MATSSILSNTSLELERPKSARHSFLLDYFDVFGNLVRHLVVDEALAKRAISRALVRIERMPFESSDPLLIYKQARRAVIREAVAVLKEHPDRLYRRNGQRPLRFAVESLPIKAEAEIL